LAACVLTESGKPWRSTIALIVRPFPRFVAPISAPLCRPDPLAIVSRGSQTQNIAAEGLIGKSPCEP
jgi:hypothetical protein